MCSEKMCPCGQPLHYASAITQKMVEAEVEEVGECVAMAYAINGHMRVFLVPRHWIALHGTNLDDVMRMKFAEITGPAREDARPGAGAGRSSR